MSLLDDLDRVTKLVAAGTDEQRAWFAKWRLEFVAAADRQDDRACEDLCDILIVYERTQLRPPERFYTLEEVIVEFGFDLADFEFPEDEGEPDESPPPR